MGPVFHRPATCSVRSCDHRLRRKLCCSFASSSSHFRSFRVPADRNSFLPPCAEKVTIPSISNGESEVQGGGTVFSKVRLRWEKSPGGWVPSPSSPASTSAHLWIFRIRETTTGPREGELQQWMIMVSTRWSLSQRTFHHLVNSGLEILQDDHIFWIWLERMLPSPLPTLPP